MTFIPPEPHKFYKRSLSSMEQYCMLIKYDRKYSWWEVEKFSVGDKCAYKMNEYETMGDSDKWEAISEREYYCAMNKLGRTLVDKAALMLVEADKPEPEVTGIKKWLCDMIGVKGIPNETKESKESNNED